MSNWYVTKYALTSGILEIPDEQCEVDGPWLWWNEPGSQYKQLFGKSHSFRTKSEAQSVAIAMARKKIAASKKTIARMEDLITGWESEV